MATRHGLLPFHSQLHSHCPSWTKGQIGVSEVLVSLKIWELVWFFSITDWGRPGKCWAEDPANTGEWIYVGQLQLGPLQQRGFKSNLTAYLKGPNNQEREIETNKQHVGNRQRTPGEDSWWPTKAIIRIPKEIQVQYKEKTCWRKEYEKHNFKIRISTVTESVDEFKDHVYPVETNFSNKKSGKENILIMEKRYKEIKIMIHLGKMPEHQGQKEIILH